MPFAIFHLPFGNQRVAVPYEQVSAILDQVDCINPDNAEIVKTTQITLLGDKPNGTYVRVTETLDEVVNAFRGAEAGR